MSFPLHGMVGKARRFDLGGRPAGEEPVGRAMDFLSQEVFRELNTIGAKANSAPIAQHVVNGKMELEKIREQVQNVQ